LSFKVLSLKNALPDLELLIPGNYPHSAGIHLQTILDENRF